MAIYVDDCEMPLELNEPTTDAFSKLKNAPFDLMTKEVVEIFLLFNMRFRAISQR